MKPEGKTNIVRLSHWMKQEHSIIQWIRKATPKGHCYNSTHSRYLALAGS